MVAAAVSSRPVSGPILWHAMPMRVKGRGPRSSYRCWAAEHNENGWRSQQTLRQLLSRSRRRSSVSLVVNVVVLVLGVFSLQALRGRVCHTSYRPHLHHMTTVMNDLRHHSNTALASWEASRRSGDAIFLQKQIPNHPKTRVNCGGRLGDTQCKSLGVR